jgi:AcrR family transcriptional regulator
VRQNQSGRRPPGRPAASLEQDAREQLIAAATELFSKQGAAATTFAMIAVRAGLSPAMLHYYFKSRDQLLDAVVEERLAPLVAAVWSPVVSNVELPQLIRGIVERMLAGVERMPWIPSTWMREVLNEDGLLRSRMLRRLPRDKIQILREAIQRDQKKGTVNPDLDPTLSVFSLIGLVMMHMATLNLVAEVSASKPPGRKAICRHITGLLLCGLQGGSPSRLGKGWKRS